MSFTTVPDALRAAGKSASNKAGRLRGADCADPIGRLPGAIPGGKAAASAARCRDSLAATLTDWCTQAQRFGEHLGTAADEYQRGDHTAAGVFPAAPGMRGPR